MKPAGGSIRAFFKPASKGTGAKRASGAAAAAPAAAAAASDALAAASEPAAATGDPPPPPAVFARKRRRTSGGSLEAAASQPAAAAGAAAAVAAGGGGPPATARPSPPTAAAPPAAAAVAEAGAVAAAPGTRPRPLTQMYLDVGQRHFHSYRCPTCGMLYARGTDADERLHAAFHASATQGPRYQGWAGERVVQLDGSKGRVLLFGSADQGRPRKQLAELCGFLEEQMGLAKGWLLQVPLTVLLYVSAARRVQAFVAAEAIKEAYCVLPSLPPAAAQGMLSCGSAVQPGSGSGAAATAGGSAAPGAGLPAAAVAAQAQVATSGRSLLSVTLSTEAAAAECSSGAAAAGEDGVAAGGAAGDATDPQQQAEQQAQQGQQAPQQEAAAAPPPQQAPPPPALPPLELDRSRRVRAVCGVRLMWVSLEARRRGLASRLLDCCRSHFMPGYVLPRHELAFSAPTDDGRAFIEQYAGSRKFLVFE